MIYAIVTIFLMFLLICGGAWLLYDMNKEMLELQQKLEQRDLALGEWVITMKQMNVDLATQGLELKRSNADLKHAKLREISIARQTKRDLTSINNLYVYMTILAKMGRSGKFQNKD